METNADVQLFSVAMKLCSVSQITAAVRAPTTKFHHATLQSTCTAKNTLIGGIALPTFNLQQTCKAAEIS
jgi:hypothetical protein